MPRPRKRRKVCQLPGTKEFRPVGELSDDLIVTMTVDEYEAIRLIDDEGFSREECAAYMEVGRTTVQQIYDEARRKIARVLVEGATLRIEGGDFRLCDGEERRCGCGGCAKHRGMPLLRDDEEVGIMKVAVSIEENKADVCPFAARSPYYLIHGEEGDEVVENPAAHAESGAGMQAAQLLIDKGVTDFIAVRVGMNAGEALNAAGITVWKSVGKTAAEDIAAFEAGELEKETEFFGGFHGIR